MPSQQILVIGSARLDTFRQTGDSLAGRFYSLRLHPFSDRKWCEQTGAKPEAALSHLLGRGGFPKPLLAATDADADAQRWRRQYVDGLVRNDVREFSRLQEVGAIALFADMLRSRVGSLMSLAAIARNLPIAQPPLARCLEK